MKNVILGTLGGFTLGCMAMVGRNIVTVTCPVTWIPGNAACFGLIANDLAKNKNYHKRAVVAAAAAGAALGIAELAAYPVTAPLNIAQNCCLPIVGAVVGGYIGSQEQ